jgi:hypothetical protein
MGLLTGYQDDAERLARQDKNLMRGYAHDVRGLKAEAAPHEAKVKDYNAQVEGFNHSAYRENGELWQIIGHYSTAFHETPGKIIATPADQTGRSVYTGKQIYGNDMYRGAWAGQPNGGYSFGDSGTKTIRDASGNPISARGEDTRNIYYEQGGPELFYASWNHMPVVKPVTQSQIDAAKASDGVLSEIGGRGEVMRGEFDASQGALSKKGGRIESDIAMNKGAISAELAPETGGSVFDQTKVFQSITDWLKG